MVYMKKFLLITILICLFLNSNVSGYPGISATPSTIDVQYCAGTSDKIEFLSLGLSNLGNSWVEFYLPMPMYSSFIPPYGGTSTVIWVQHSRHPDIGTYDEMLPIAWAAWEGLPFDGTPPSTGALIVPLHINVIDCSVPPTPIPEFPSAILSATMITVFLGVVLYIRRTKEH